MGSIVFISKSHVINSIGGAEMQMDILAQALTKKGWDVTYVTNAVKSFQYFNRYKLIPAPTVKMKFWECLSKIDADIYYQRGRKQLTAWIGEFCAKKHKKFLFSLANDTDCLKYRCLRSNGASSSEIFKSMFYLYKNLKLDYVSLQGMHKANLVLSQTQFQKKRLKENLGIDSEVFYNVHNIPKVNYIYRKTKTPIILWLANMKPRKRPEIFMKLAKEMKNVDCKFLMAGGVKTERYSKLIKRTSVDNPNFEYVGPVSLEESTSLFAIADIFVSTSDNQEGFPNTFIQAWMHGVPTVSLHFDPDGLIFNKNMGFVSDNNYLKLKDSICILLNNCRLKTELGENARIFSTENFNLTKRIDNFIEMLNAQII